ncbi:MAG: hypothetical protein NZL83_04315 [Candidatus Absconditabacterales bacterium]|nr:hypothetical protein [Candidatus Absconditabacterales bacterium]
MFLVWIIILLLRHWLTTWLHFGLNIGGSVAIFGLLRDGGWMMMTCIFFVRGCYKARDPLLSWKDNGVRLVRFVGGNGWLCVGLLVCVTAYAIVRTGFATPWLFLVGFKSLIFPFVLLISGVVLGLVYPISSRMIKRGLGLFALGCLVFGSVKIFFPSMMERLGYGPVGDWVANQAPPVYYRTGPGGIPRFAGAFAGPNALMYVLVFFLPLLGSFVAHTWQKIVVWTVGGLMGVATIARGFLVGVSTWFLLLLCSYTSRIVRLVIVGCVVLAIVCVGWLSFSDLKYGSTIERLEKWHEAANLIVQRPRIGYGLGMSGPGYFWGGLVVPENLYLQVILDLGLIGFLGRVVTRWVLVFAIKRFVVYDVWLSRCGGLAALAAVGLVLHPVEDATVNMLIFGMGTWMIVGRSRNQDIAALR